MPNLPSWNIVSPKNVTSIKFICIVKFLLKLKCRFYHNQEDLTLALKIVSALKNMVEYRVPFTLTHCVIESCKVNFAACSQHYKALFKF